MKYTGKSTHDGLKLMTPFLLPIVLLMLHIVPLMKATTVFKEFTQSDLTWESFNRTEVLPAANTGRDPHDILTMLVMFAILIFLSYSILC